MSNKTITIILLEIILTIICSGCLPGTNSSRQVQEISIAEIVEDTELITPNETQSPTNTPIPSATPPLPTPAPTAVPAQPLLAYLREGNVWLYDFANGNEIQLTDTGNIKAFAWSPDGSQLGLYDNQWQLCFRSLEPTIPTYPCQTIEKATNLFAADHAPTKLMWSPTGQQILIQQAEWWQVNLNTSQVRHIADPRDWGATWTAGDEGGTALGQALYLPDGSLLGAAAHVYDCGSGGCMYRLFVFDEASQRLMPYAYSNGGSSLAMTTNGRYLMTNASPHVGCATYTSYTDIIDLSSGQLWSSTFPQETFFDQALAPQDQKAILSPGEGCAREQSELWSVECGLMPYAFELFPMQVWDWQNKTRQELVPGLEPAWSPNGQQIAFRSCLAQTPAGEWTPVSASPPWLYSMNLSDSSYTITPIAIGEAPAWQPRLP